MKQIPCIESFKFQICFKQECKALISAFFRYVDQEIKEILENNTNNYIKRVIVLL